MGSQSRRKRDACTSGLQEQKAGIAAGQQVDVAIR